ncbi:DUF3742 family protein [Xanthomonas euvesicatoria]|uniref:DUF3742 family protein n=1 Tax=Xanthomonas euvesicatoria TaxID=456327 RepID=UPI001C47C56A|nr:DUF3742 family protein [Xanthomonas euvesicatoria]MBV6791642.1 DUF3742 family protein [Xanthomonas campestris pv. clerodendri]
MKTAVRTTFAERAGRAFGRMWRGFARRERQTVGWLVVRGMPAGVATALLWAVKLSVFGVLLYAAFWLALLLAFALAATWVARNGGLEEKEQKPEWRDGLLGFGLYHPDGSRIDPHDPDEEM